MQDFGISRASLRAERHRTSATGSLVARGAACRRTSSAHRHHGTIR